MKSNHGSTAIAPIKTEVDRPRVTLLSQYVIKLSLQSVLLFFSNKAIFSYRVVTIDRSLAAEKSDYPLVAPRVFCNVNGGNRIQNGFL